MNGMIGLILAGGSGNRFWPISKGSTPKQLLHLLQKDRSMLEETILRIEPVIPRQDVFISTSESLAPVIEEKCIAEGAALIKEPDKKSTLGALIWCAASLVSQHKRSPDEVMAVFAADHFVGEQELFHATLKRAIHLAETRGDLVTLGIAPNRPETGYGYIEIGAGIQEDSEAFQAVRFIEKPGLEDAAHFLMTGRFLWNSGMLIMRISSFVSELKAHLPAAGQTYDAICAELRSGDVEAAKSAFSKLESESVDTALLQKSNRITVLKSHFPWDDVGTWTSLERIKDASEHGNVVSGRCITLDAEGCILQNHFDGLPVAVIGLSNIVVVAAPEGILVCDRDSAQRVRDVPELLNLEGHSPSRKSQS